MVYSIYYIKYTSYGVFTTLNTPSYGVFTPLNTPYGVHVFTTLNNYYIT